MSAATRALLAGFLLAALALVLDTSDRSAAHTGFAALDRRVQRLVDADWFRLGRTDGAVAIVLAPDPSTARPDPARLRAIAGVPGLRARMLDPDRWIVAGETVAGVRSERAADPFDVGWTWHGEMTFARFPREPVIPLIRLAEHGVPRGRIELTPSPRPLTLTRGATRAHLAAAAPLAGTVRLALFDLDCPGGGAGALVYRVDDEVAVNAQGMSGCAVRVGEHLLNDRASCRRLAIEDSRCHFAVLRAGDMLVVGDEGQRAVRFQRRARIGEPKVMRRNALFEKIPAPGLAPFVDAAAVGLRDAMNGCRETLVDLAGGCAGDLPLSLDQEVQEAAGAEIARLRSQRNGPGGSTLPMAASIVVMNARSGEVLAMAGEQDPSGGCTFPPMCLFPIGSTAKPLFAAAMIGGYRDGNLATLRLPYRGGRSVNSILGFAFRRPLHNENRGWAGHDLGVADFLATSDNHFMAGMYLLASGEHGACPLRGDWYAIDGQREAGRRPRSAFEGADCRGFGDSFQPPFRPAWAGRLAHYFDIEPYSRLDAPANYCAAPGVWGSATFDAAPWHPILRDGQHCQMRAAGLARKWYDINALRDFRNRALLLALGNGDGQWSAVKLAEAYSRLATGRRVRATFIDQKGRPAGAVIDFSADRVRPTGTGNDARVAVSRGLARVLRGTALPTRMPTTADALARRLAADGLRLGIFAKTGTMQLDGSASAAGCPRGYLALGDCVGKAFVVTLAVYRPDAANLTFDEATGRAVDARAEPQCAITIAVNLFQWNGSGPNAAAQSAAELVDAIVARRLTEKDRFCADHG